VDEEGRPLLINRARRVLLGHFSFKAPVAAAAFSPDGAYIAVAVGKLMQVRQGVQERVAVPLALQTCGTVHVMILSQP